jgi:hypothetical protein
MAEPHWLRRSAALLVGLVATIAVHLVFVTTFVPGIVLSLGEGGDAAKVWAAAADALAFLLGVGVVAAEGRDSSDGTRPFRLRR